MIPHVIRHEGNPFLENLVSSLADDHALDGIFLDDTPPTRTVGVQEVFRLVLIHRDENDSLLHETLALVARFLVPDSSMGSFRIALEQTRKHQFVLVLLAEEADGDGWVDAVLGTQTNSTHVQLLKAQVSMGDRVSLASELS